MPIRTDVDATSIPRLLPFVWMGSRIKDDGWRYRLAGEAVNLVHGCPLRGRRPIDVMSPTHAAAAAARMSAIVDGPFGVYSVGTLPIRSGVVVPTERLSLPLADADGVPRHVIGIFLHTLARTDAPQSDLWHQDVSVVALPAATI